MKTVNPITPLSALCLLFILVGNTPVAVADNPELSPKTLKLLEELNARQNIVYKTIDGETLDMTLFLPETTSDSKMPIMLYTHGGGWGGGDKYKIFRNVFLDTLRILLDNGIACASIEYRLTRENRSTAVDCVIDCMDAARFLVKHANTYNIDPQRMGVWGGSAGGHLALMTGLADPSLFQGDAALSGIDPQFKCIASYYPAVSFVDTELFKGSNFERPQRMVPMLGGLLEDKREEAALISPVNHLKETSPSIMVLHGDNDQVLSYAHAKYFMKIARKVGSDVRLVTVEGGGHGFSGDNISPSMEEISQQAAEFILTELADWSWPEPDPQAVKAWQNLRFGMFIH